MLFHITVMAFRAWYFMLAWNSKIQKRLGRFGLATLGKGGLRSEKGILTRDHPMARLRHVDLFVQMRVID